MSGICAGRVVIITGAGRGLGRAHALAFAREGARLVINDTGVERDGTGGDHEPADTVLAEVRALGGEAVASYEDAADWDGAARLIQAALTSYGQLDVLVNNAGILRDRMLVNMTEDDWDGVIRTHLRGVFAPTRHAAAYWRERAKAGQGNDARVICTSSPSGLYGNIGQANYGAAKAGIASFALIVAAELGRYGVTVNAIAPGARTRMTEGLPVLGGAVLDGAEPDGAAGEADDLAAERVSPLVVWLGSAESREITGRVFNVWGSELNVAEGWHSGPGVRQPGTWDPADLGAVVPGLVAKAAPNCDMWGQPIVAG
jgi:NAD(P)-dependent dehydrogenase (short-subunit alcohol dehydrogenase family)